MISNTGIYKSKGSINSLNNISRIEKIVLETLYLKREGISTPDFLKELKEKEGIDEKNTRCIVEKYIDQGKIVFCENWKIKRAY